MEIGRSESSNEQMRFSPSMSPPFFPFPFLLTQQARKVLLLPIRDGRDSNNESEKGEPLFFPSGRVLAAKNNERTSITCPKGAFFFFSSYAKVKQGDFFLFPAAISSTKEIVRLDMGASC